MDCAKTRRHLVTFRAVLVLFMSIPAVSLLPKEEVTTCREGDFLTDDHVCCHKCPQGYKLVEKCPGHGYRTNCAPCPPDQYMDQMNYFPNCFSCKRCRASIFEIQVSPCTKTQNTVCRCKDGFYKSHIDSVTYECLRCSTCGDDEKEVKKCSPEANTECRCKDNHHRVKNKCLPCTNCTTKPECTRDCPLGTRKDSADTPPFVVNIVAGAAVAVVLTLVLVIVITHFVTKRQTERRLLSSQEYKDSPYEELTVHSEEPSLHILQAAPLSNGLSQEPSNLPDCIPLEIKIPDVIYSLLDLVPVLRVKQLVRLLGVGDTVIERAELDHRSSREAHYQMLRSWAEQGDLARGGQGGVLHLPLLHQLLDTLRLMHLEQTAQELETKYNLL